MTEILDRLEYDHTPAMFRLGFVRYEALRKLKPREFESLHQRNLAGENFDAMVDALVIEGSKP